MVTPKSINSSRAMFCFLYNVDERIGIYIIASAEDPNFEMDSHSNITLHYSLFSEVLLGFFLSTHLLDLER